MRTKARRGALWRFAQDPLPVTVLIRVHADLREAITHYHYDYGVQFARASVMAFCPDARGFGERLEKILRGNIYIYIYIPNPVRSSTGTLTVSARRLRECGSG